jgi:uncharacterized phage protein (TIGR01671 family)
MREIKFRAWDKQEKEMYNWEYIGKLLGSEYFSEFVKKEIIILMQYTGLKDINNKEIYESDIVKSTATPHLTCDYLIWEVVWDHHQFEYRSRWALKSYDGNPELTSIDRIGQSALKPIEIIGNIWENEELLDEKYS